MLLNKDNNVKKFVITVENFCNLVDNGKQIEKRDFFKKSIGLLSQLINQALLLPDVEPEANHPLETAVEHEYYMEIQKKIADKFGKNDYYWFIYDPVKGGEPVGSSLPTDFVDIYKDLKTGLEVYLKGDEASIIGAVWHWRFGFHSGNWSFTAINALKAISNIFINY